MRRGEEAAISKIGGAWQCAVRTPAGEYKPCDALNAGSAATGTSVKDEPCVEAGCTKGACMDGIVLQHSWLCWWPCDEQGIESPARASTWQGSRTHTQRGRSLPPPAALAW